MTSDNSTVSITIGCKINNGDILMSRNVTDKEISQIFIHATNKWSYFLDCVPLSVESMLSHEAIHSAVFYCEGKEATIKLDRLCYSAIVLDYTGVNRWIPY